MKVDTNLTAMMTPSLLDYALELYLDKGYVLHIRTADRL